MSLRLGTLLRAHEFMKIERPPVLWPADTEDTRFVPLFGEMIAGALGKGTPLAELTLSAANVVVEPEAGSPDPGEYVALTVRGVADFGADATWKPSAPPPTGLLARLHERLLTAGARYAYLRRLPPDASFTVFLARARFVEWSQPIVRVDDALRFVEASYEHGTHSFLIEARLLPEEFFELRTRFAGEFVQKLVNYQLRVAAVVPTDPSRGARFAELVSELQRSPVFRVFAARREAEAWLAE